MEHNRIHTPVFRNLENDILNFQSQVEQLSQLDTTDVQEHDTEALRANGSKIASVDVPYIKGAYGAFYGESKASVLASAQKALDTAEAVTDGAWIDKTVDELSTKIGSFVRHNAAKIRNQIPGLREFYNTVEASIPKAA